MSDHEQATDEEFFAEMSEGEPVPFPMPSGKIVYVERMSGNTYMRYQVSCSKAERDEEGFDMHAMGRLIVFAVTNGKGKQRWTEEAIPRLMGGRTDILKPLFELCQRENGLDPESREAAKKNSSTARTSPSSTGLPATSESPTRNGSLETLAALQG